MEFEAMSCDELSAYLRSVPGVYALLNEPAELDIAEVGDGNLNYVYFASNTKAPEKSVVVKQAPPFLRLVGKSWPLTRHRMEREVAALRRFGALCPQHVPRVYHADNERFLMVMQRLSSHRILRQGLMDGVVYPKLAGHLSTYLAHTLFFGSDLYLAPDVKKQAVSAATNSELCKITEDLVFTYPFEDHPSNAYSPAFSRAEIERLWRSPALRVAVGEMKWSFMNDAQTLLHGDLHTGSIMVNEDETYVIDPEFAFYGPMGFDIGAVLANLLLAYFSRDWHDRDKRANGELPYRDWLLEQATQIWTGFADQFVALWREHESRRKSHFIGDDRSGACEQAFRTRFMQRLFAASLGFAGCKMIRRIVGMAKVADVTSIADDALRASVEVRALRCAERLLVERHAIAGIGDVVALAREIHATRYAQT
ncbi:S-methyl-5-thioribose kinase [Paraburkholderia rhizosphaerae]|uniref:S-methyl-5-thioribose kinase n=1 Tax=Paraburkholderia rhizosphaerae TaxID=480658 RepID=A0A4R8L852_9BURK|nr:S-methyl-5-thioribose kinase [Paraburkholderia rhizosphaerae]TDY38927.1 5'-methylthioribose kinase [Paraburkholderia rhizosphaerae]